MTGHFSEQLMNPLATAQRVDHDGVVPALLDSVRFAFQPLVNLKTGGIFAIEALARPRGAHVYDLFNSAQRSGNLAEFDLQLASRAVLQAAEHETLLPLHLNLFAETVVRNPLLEPLCAALEETGRRCREIVLDIGGPFTHFDTNELVHALQQLRSLGYRVALDCVGEGDLPLLVITDLAPDYLKVDRALIADLAEAPIRLAMVEALTQFCSRTGIQLVAEGVETQAELQSLRGLGVYLAQGELVAPASRRPAKTVQLPPTAVEATDTGLSSIPTAGPRVVDFLHPATMLSADSTSDKVRTVLANEPSITSIVLVDEQEQPRWTVDRNRFLLAVTGPYGHALHANRKASRLADKPRTVTTAATAMEVLDSISVGTQGRSYDDIVVVDEGGRCLGVIRVADIVRGMAELKVEEAATLNPLTRLPGGEITNADIDLRIAEGQIFAASWLDVDHFKRVNDNLGFSAGDDLIRGIGRSLTDAAATIRSLCVGHIGGDDFLIVLELDDLMTLATNLLDTARSIDGMPITVSMATLVCAGGTVADHRQVSRLLAPLKKRAKALQGSSWVLGRPGSNRVDILRGNRPPEPAPMRDTG